MVEVVPSDLWGSIGNSFHAVALEHLLEGVLIGWPESTVLEKLCEREAFLWIVSSEHFPQGASCKWSYLEPCRPAHAPAENCLWTSLCSSGITLLTPPSPSQFADVGLRRFKKTLILSHEVWELAKKGTETGWEKKLTKKFLSSHSFKALSNVFKRLQNFKNMWNFKTNLEACFKLFSLRTLQQS